MVAVVAIGPVLVATFLALQMVDPLVGVPTAARIAYHLLTILVYETRRSGAGSSTFALTCLRLVVLRHFHFPHNFPVWLCERRSPLHGHKQYTLPVTLTALATWAYCPQARYLPQGECPGRC